MKMTKFFANVVFWLLYSNIFLHFLLIAAVDVLFVTLAFRGKVPVYQVGMVCFALSIASIVVNALLVSGIRRVLPDCKTEITRRFFDTLSPIIALLYNFNIRV